MKFPLSDHHLVSFSITHSRAPETSHDDLTSVWQKYYPHLVLLLLPTVDRFNSDFSSTLNSLAPLPTELFSPPIPALAPSHHSPPVSLLSCSLTPMGENKWAHWLFPPTTDSSFSLSFCQLQLAKVCYYFCFNNVSSMNPQSLSSIFNTLLSVEWSL